MIKLPFLSKSISKFFSLPSPSKTCALPLDFALEKDSKNISYYISMTERIIRTRSSTFYYMVDMNIYTRNLPVCHSGQYIYVTGLCNFFFALQDLIDRINSYFQRIVFQRNLQRNFKFFPMKICSLLPSLEWSCVNL